MRDYRIVRCQLLGHLENEISELLRKGAIPIGGPFRDPQHSEWCQAVAFPTDPAPPRKRT